MTDNSENLLAEELLEETPYRIEDGKFCYLRPSRNGSHEVIPLCNFVAQCGEEISLDDGRGAAKYFLVSGKLDNGQPLPPVRIKASEFPSMNWVTRDWGIGANLAAGQGTRDKVREAIQTISQDAKQRTVFTHTGWRKVNGVWVFLHAGGALGGSSGVEVDLGSELSRYSLPEPGALEAARASMRLLEVAPWEITAPLIACAYLAPLTTQLQVDFTLWLLGPTGALKSSLVAVILSHFGDFDHTTLPGQWASTANALERRAFILKDLLFVIDDFAPPPDSRAAADLEQRAHRILRAAGNRAGRQRLTGEMTEYQTFDPRSLIISTGEILPSGVQSIAARYLTVKMEREQVDKRKLTQAQAEKDLYAQAMSAYISQVLAPDLESISDTSRRLWQSYRDSAQMGAHPRIPEMVGYLGVGFDLFTLFLQEKGAVPSSQAEEMRDRAWEVFMNRGHAHAKVIEGERPTVRFLHVLQELFTQKKVYVCGQDGNSPMRNKLLPLWDELGWKSPDAPGTNAEHIGWYGDDCLYLMPEATFKVVQEFLRRQGSYMSMGKNSLFKALADEGFIESNQEGETTRVKKIQGAPKRVLFLKPQAIL